MLRVPNNFEDYCAESRRMLFSRMSPTDSPSMTPIQRRVSHLWNGLATNSGSSKQRLLETYFSDPSALRAISLTVVPSAFANAKLVMRLALRCPLSIMEIALRLTPDFFARLS